MAKFSPSYKSENLAKTTESCVLGGVSIMTARSLTPREQTGLISSCLKEQY